MKVKLSTTSATVLRVIRNEQDSTGGKWVTIKRLSELIPAQADGTLNDLLNGLGYLEIDKARSAVKITAAGRNALIAKG